MLRWAKDLDKVCIGLNATDLASMKPIMRACMRPRVETLFEATLLALAELDKAVALKTAQVADRGTGATANADQVTLKRALAVRLALPTYMLKEQRSAPPSCGLTPCIRRL